tara:strand:- start:6231 stop:8822 length:2592 start_codon:yes stop_codon:yes gene_type:complete
MKKIYLSLLTLCITLISVQLANAQFFEDFESGDKSFYGGGSVALVTGSWYLEDALLGNLSNDKFNGSKGVRMDRRDPKQGNIYMLFDKANGAEDLSFSYANYGSSSGNTLQVQYSTDQGSSWTNLGEPLSPTGELSVVTIPVDIQGNIRFKFIQAGGTDRLNLDDVRITDFVQAQDNATIAVTVDGTPKATGESATFPTTLVGTKRTVSLSIKNIGTPDLSISNIELQGQAFSITNFSDSTLAFSESTELTVTYEPFVAGNDEGSIVITSNADNAASFTINLAGEGIEDGDIIPISDARSLPLGSRVTVTGRVTAANELGGPLYMQDATAGIAVYWEALHAESSIGDSVTVTGPLSVFKPIAGADSDFLLQISSTTEDSNILYEVIDTENKKIVPEVLTIAEVLAGAYEAQLVEIKSATVSHVGVFQGNTNYTMSDASGEIFLRIDNNVNLVGATAPTEAVNVVGVIGKFGGDLQVLPRFVDDLGVEETTYPGDDIDLINTLDMVTWNVEWFGHSGNGPVDVDLQLQNAKTVITTMDADIYALSEISDVNKFNQLVSELEDYGGFMANFSSQTQNTAFLFKRSVIDSLDSGLITAGMTQSNWANGRYPLEFHFNATLNDEEREVYAYVIHAKAFGTESDYNQRLNASTELKSYLDNNRDRDNVIILGDYNDLVTTSTFTGSPSPYKNFVDDSEYTVITKSLEENGSTSYTSISMIDHITITSELSDEYIVGSERVENTFYVGSYLSTTSDHYPVWTRFQYGTPVSNEDEIASEIPSSISLNQNYPNPFNPTTVISYSLNARTQVKLQVFDITGRNVATLVNKVEAAGEKSINFDASSLSSGLYFYRLTTSEGASLTRKMMLIK